MKKFLGILIGVLIVCLIMFITNPSKGEFNEYYKNEVSSSVSSEINNDSIFGELVNTLVPYASNVADYKFQRENYIFFSIYESNSTLISSSEKYLGLFRMFVEIDKQ